MNHGDGFICADELDARYGTDCPLSVGQRVMLDGTTLYGTVTETADADFDHDGEKFFQCAWIMATVVWDDGTTDTHTMEDLLVNRSEVTEKVDNSDLSPLWSGYAIESP